METIKYGKIVDFVHMLIKNSYFGQDNLQFVDATCGNGFDTLFLCNVAGSSGHVKAFDIQDQAIERTKKLLEDNIKFNNYEIIKDSHELISKYLTSNIDAAIFNLGYLPFSDKTITTKGDTTLSAIKSLLPYLKDTGRIYVTTYISHDIGNVIKEIHSFLSKLDKSKYNVLHVSIENKENSPPELYIVEKNA